MPDRPWGQFHEKALRFGWATQKTQETNSIINIRCPPWLPQYWIGALANDLQSSQLKDFESARTEAEFFLVASRAWIIFSCWSLTSRVFSHSISPPCTAIFDYQPCHDPEFESKHVTATALPWQSRRSWQRKVHFPGFLALPEIFQASGHLIPGPRIPFPEKRN